MNLDEKRALVASRLPKLLALGKHLYAGQWCWLDTWQPVTEREWLEVMRLAEKTLTGGLLAGSPMYRYTRMLHDIRSGMGHLADADERLDAFCRVVGQDLPSATPGN